MASPFLNIIPVGAGQNNKEVTINDADLALERATQDILTVDMSAGNVTLSVAQFTRHMVFRCINVNANANLVIPHNVGQGANTAKRVFSVMHDTEADTTITVTTASGSASSVPLRRAMKAILSSDGANIRPITVTGGVEGISIACFVPGEMPGSSPVLRYTSVMDFTLPAGFVGSYGSVQTPPDGGDVVFDIRLNGISIGSMEFADGESDATFSLAAPRLVLAGDVVSVLSPPDTYGLVDLSFSILGT